MGENLTIQRKPLKGTVVLCAESDGALFCRSFRIVKKVSEGSYCLCYEAYHEKSGRGILKEFFPEEISRFSERDPEGRIVFLPEFEAVREEFMRQQERYLKAYRMLTRIKQQEDTELESFIPAFEVYYGCREEKGGQASGPPQDQPAGTAYIWMPESKLQPFDRLCGEIHAHPEKEPARRMLTVLRAVETLTRCLCMLHRAGLVHRDIKPSNFGFVLRDQEVLTQTLSMFDVDSVCSVYDPPAEIMGTEGFMEPEAAWEKPDNRTDIYSIGATLFFAVAGSEQTLGTGYCYSGEYYPQLRDLVNMSDLVCATEANSHPRLRSALCRILEKSLCPRKARYRCCEEMLEDLETAIYYALPSEIAGKARSGERWVLQDALQVLEQDRAGSSLPAIQYHLWRYPLYKKLPRDASALNVLIAGFGNYGQRFLDVCLQIGQLPGKKLQVTVLSADPEDREIYLADRPELAQFYDVDGSLGGAEDSYGGITFSEMHFSETSSRDNAALLQNWFCSLPETGQPQYIFTALGSDALSLSAAGACREAADVLEMVCEVSCACEHGHFPAKKYPGVRPVFVKEDVKGDPLYAEIERMAYNCHLVWEKNLNVNRRLVRSAYQKPYNHNSCVGNVLSMKYKLYGIGIDLDSCGPQEAAVLAEGKRLGSGKKDNAVKNELIWLEHRRWVTEKLCMGWRQIRDVRECASGETKDTRGRRHICLRRSRPDQLLAAKFSLYGSYKKWDTASEEELDELDELDRMSVDLHRVYARQARAARGKNLLGGSIMQSIRALLEGDQAAFAAFQEWHACLTDIWNGDRAKERLYKGLRDDFLEAAKGLAPAGRKALGDQVRAFEALFAPIRLSVQYTDWKQQDTALIENIPFILSYTENSCLVIPFETGTASRIFRNVAAASVINPARILYMFLAEKQQDLKALEESLPYIFGYLRKKEIRAQAELLLACSGQVLEAAEKGFAEKLQAKAGPGLKRIRLLPAPDVRTLARDLENILKRKSRSRAFFALERNETGLSRMLEGAGLYGRFAHYAFDPETMAFTVSADCAMPRFIRKKPYITAADMMSVRRSSGAGRSPEFYADYRRLWERYTKNPRLWKLLCGILEEHAGAADLLAAFSKKDVSMGKREEKEYRYLLPFACSGSVSRIIQGLKQGGIAGDRSRVGAFSTGTCEAVIYDRMGNKPQYDRLFSRIYELMDPEAISLAPDGKGRYLRVCFDDLRAENILIAGGRKAELLSLLRFFESLGYLIRLREADDDRVSFLYASREIKELLITAGKMLEVYTYHKAKETGQFDDVVSSFEVEWEDMPDLRNEFDCILTKGFKTLIVECKARAEIEQGFYYKIAELAQHFGINTTAVLIADTREEAGSEAAARAGLQRRRGNRLDVVTVWKPEEIANIGMTLLQIINGKYESS